jgi:hypothetical protein
MHVISNEQHEANEVDKLKATINVAKQSLAQCYKEQSVFHHIILEAEEQLKLVIARQRFPLHVELQARLTTELINICQDYYNYVICQENLRDLFSNSTKCIYHALKFQLKYDFQSPTSILSSQFASILAVEHLVHASFVCDTFREILSSWLFQLENHPNLFLTRVLTRHFRKNVPPRSFNYGMRLENDNDASMRIYVVLSSIPVLAMYYKFR